MEMDHRVTEMEKQILGIQKELQAVDQLRRRMNNLESWIRTNMDKQPILTTAPPLPDIGRRGSVPGSIFNPVVQPGDGILANHQTRRLQNNNNTPLDVQLFEELVEIPLKLAKKARLEAQSQNANNSLQLPAAKTKDVHPVGMTTASDSVTRKQFSPAGGHRNKNSASPPQPEISSTTRTSPGPEHSAQTENKQETSPTRGSSKTTTSTSSKSKPGPKTKSQGYYCKKCDIQFNSNRVFMMHNNHVHRRYGCVKCIKKFEKLASLKQHESDSHVSNNYTQANTSHKQAQRANKRRSSSPDILVIESPVYSNKNKASQRKSNDNHTLINDGRPTASGRLDPSGQDSSRTYSIISPGRVTTSTHHGQATHSINRKSNADEPIFACETCGKNFGRLKTLNLHLQTHETSRSLPALSRKHYLEDMDGNLA